MMNELYERGDICGWAEVRFPGLAKREFNLLSKSGYFSKFRIVGSSDNKPTKTMLYLVARKALGQDLPDYRQEVGDCFNGSTLIRMSDGSEKRIDEFVGGEYVITPFGNIRKVLRVIKKPYNKSMLSISCRGNIDKTICTPDHLLMCFNNKKGYKDKPVWKRAEDITADDWMLNPKWLNWKNETILDMSNFGKCYIDSDNFEKLRTKAVPKNKTRLFNTKANINRYVVLDDRLMWLIGLYAAEGSGEKHRITFNLSIDEIHIANRIKKYIVDIFGDDINVKIYSVPSKPTVLYVRIDSVLIVRMFKHFCNGNTYTKEIHHSLNNVDIQNKDSLLSGWMDGDGWKNMIGVSTNKKLANFMRNSAISIGLDSSIYLRPAYKQSKESYAVRIGRKSKKHLNKYGKLCKVTKIETVQPESDFVYCLEIDIDHCFIANNYAVHNCVSHGAKNATEYLQCVQKVVANDNIKIRPVFPPYYYGSGRVYVGRGRLGNQDGSLGSWMAQAVMRYGTLFSDEPRVPKYSGSIARSWGDSNPTNDLDLWLPTAKNYLIQATARIKTWNELYEAITNGYPVTIASNVGYNMLPSSDGFHRKGENWAHQMCIIGIDNNKNYGIIKNSWGDVHGTLKDFEDGHVLPPSCLRVRREDIELMLQTGEAYAYSNFKGFPDQSEKIQKSMFDLIGK